MPGSFLADASGLGFYMLNGQIAWIWVQIWVRVGIAYFLIACLYSFFLGMWDVLASPPVD